MPGKKEIRNRLLALGRNQYGVVSRRQLLAGDFSERQIEHYLSQGALWPFFRATYSIGQPVVTWRAAWLSAVLAAGEGAMLTGGAAASLWGLAQKQPTVVDVLRGRGKNRTEFSSAVGRWRLKLRIWRRSEIPRSPSLVDHIPVLPVPELLIERAEFLPLRSWVRSFRRQVRKSI